MGNAEEKNDFAKYLDPIFISKFSNLQITTKMIIEGFKLGIHSSPMRGFSAEFSEHREYVVGDNVKFIDWKVFGKTEKYYIKQFEDETNLFANIFIDKSTSMNFKANKSDYSKLDYAKQLAAAITHILISQKDAVGYGSYADSLKSYIAPKSTKQQLMLVLKNIADNTIYQVEETYTSYEKISYKLNRSGLTIIISDLLENPDKLLEKILFLKKKKQDLIVFMIADESEYNFKFSENLKITDSETNSSINVHTSLVKEEYKKKYKDLIKLYDNELTTNNIFFKFITTNTSFNIPLLELLLLRNKRR